MERLIAVKAIYYTYLTCLKPPEDCPENPTISQLSFNHLADTNHVYNGGIQAMVRHSENRRKISARYGGAPYTLIRAEIMIASGNPNWPDFLSLDEETAALPNVASNIDGGTGLLGGIVSDTVVVLNQ